MALLSPMLMNEGEHSIWEATMPAVKLGAHREVQLPDVVTKRLRIRAIDFL
jgi:hypothetical protein